MILVLGFVLFVIRSPPVELVTLAAAELSVATGHELCQKKRKFHKQVQVNYLNFSAELIYQKYPRVFVRPGQISPNALAAQRSAEIPRTVANK
jgi:hypothetical protein